MHPWKEGVYVFDDFLNIKEQQTLETKFLGQQIQWTYIEDVSGSDGSSKKRPGFNHQVFREGRKLSPFYDDVMAMIHKAMSRLYRDFNEKHDFRLEKS